MLIDLFKPHSNKHILIKHDSKEGKQEEITVLATRDAYGCVKVWTCKNGVGLSFMEHIAIKDFHREVGPYPPNVGVHEFECI